VNFLKPIKMAEEKTDETSIIKELTNLAVDVKGELKKVSETTNWAITEVKDTLKVVKDETDKIKVMQEQLDAISAKQSKIPGGGEQKETIESAIEKAVREGADKIKAFSEGGASRVVLATKGFRIKSTDMTTPAGVVLPDQRPGIVVPPLYRVHVRDLVPVGMTSSNVYRFIQETAYTNSGNVTTEGSAKPQSDFTLANKDASVETIATFLKLSRQMLSDVDGIASYLSARGPQKLMVKEDYQLLSGSGTTPNILGLLTAASIQAYAAGITIASNGWDKLALAMAQLKSLGADGDVEYEATAVLLNPLDYVTLITNKNATPYTYPGNIFKPEGGNMFSINPLGIPVIPHSKIPQGTALVGDYAMGAQVLMREGLSLQFFEQDVDNVQKNMVTVRIEERLAFPIFHPDAFIKVSFATS
jgi:HK97 family phage major capsid protein